MSNWSTNTEGVVLLGTGSAPSTDPSSVLLYAKTDGKLYNLTTGGTETEQGTAGSAINPVINYFTSSGTWTKPTASNFAYALIGLIGAGGGGGGGRRGASIGSSGGTGGGGGAMYTRFIPSSSLTGSYTITIGIGGNSGSGATTDNTNGGGGTVGGSTIISGSNIGQISIPGGSGGLGGSAGGGTVFGGAGGDNTALRGPVAIQGGTGGRAGGGNPGFSGNTGMGPTGTNTATFVCTAGGGGGGGKILNSPFYGASGSSVYNTGSLSTLPSPSPVGSGLPAGSGSDTCFYWMIDANIQLTFGIGSSGAGGGASDTANTIAGGKGGDGGRCSGGGGGGASHTNVNGGDGGKGGDGIAVIIEYYGA